MGRGPELAAITELLDATGADAGTRGGALLVRGDPGVGKTALLAAARDEAEALGMATLTMTGVQAETHLAFAGLHQLVRPRLGRLDRLPPRQRDALAAAFGLGEPAAPELFLVALAGLELLADAAIEAPLLVVADDAQWLDPASADVLAFIARRVADEPIAVLAAHRTGWPSAIEAAGLPELHLGPLADDDAAGLLDHHAPELAPADRKRVLADAAGNPLALVELPRAMASRGQTGPAGQAVVAATEPLPLTERLERAFAARATELPEATRTALLVAAANDGDDLATVLRAIGVGVAPDAGVLEPAVAAHLVAVAATDHTIRFRHPLVRSAIYGAATDAERRAAHAALADAVAADPDHDPDRMIRHRAAAAVGPDPTLAADLEAAADRARRRGDTALALATLERAARLSGDPAVRGRLLLRAGELAFELAGAELADRYLRAAGAIDLTEQARARLVLLRELVEDQGPRAGDGRWADALGVVERMRAAGDADLAMGVLIAVAQRCWWLDVEPDARAELVAAVDDMPFADDDPRKVAATAFADPIGRCAAVTAAAAAGSDRGARRSVDPDDPGGPGGPADPADPIDPAARRLLGAAASAVGAFDVAPPLLAASIDGLRAEGRLGLLAQALVSQAWTGFFTGDWVLAGPAAEEAGRLARETGQTRWAAAADLADATLAAARGDFDRAEALADEAERMLTEFTAHPTLAFVAVARGVADLGRGEYGRAFAHLCRPLDRTDVAFHPFWSHWFVGELAEAAARGGQVDAGRAIVAELVAARPPGTRPAVVEIGLAHAAAVLAPDDEAGRRYLDAAAAGGPTGSRAWPYHHARLLLAHGSWLRRQHRVGDARVTLREARSIFDGLGAIPWGERARLELRATGETSRRRTPEAREQLTPQELQIARMAAEGMTNREIGERLYLSHRTVGSHLYRIFPKLGVTSRAQLSMRLRAEPEAVI